MNEQQRHGEVLLTNSEPDPDLEARVQALELCMADEVMFLRGQVDMLFEHVKALTATVDNARQHRRNGSAK